MKFYTGVLFGMNLNVAWFIIVIHLMLVGAIGGLGMLVTTIILTVLLTYLARIATTWEVYALLLLATLIARVVTL